MKKTMILFLVILTLVPLLAATAWAEAAAPPAQVIPIDLTPLFQVAITLLASIITAKLIPWIKRRATADQQAAIALATRTFVYAAEQIYRNEKESGNKKLMYVKAKLRERGYNIDLDTIEATVMELKLDEPVLLEAVHEIEYNEQKPPDAE